jgi:hypothetical protein
MANRLLTLARADDLKAVHAKVDNDDPRVLALAAGFLAFMVVKSTAPRNSTTNKPRTRCGWGKSKRCRSVLGRVSMWSYLICPITQGGVKPQSYQTNPWLPCSRRRWPANTHDLSSFG